MQTFSFNDIEAAYVKLLHLYAILFPCRLYILSFCITEIARAFFLLLHVRIYSNKRHSHHLRVRRRSLTFTDVICCLLDPMCSWSSCRRFATLCGVGLLIACVTISSDQFAITLTKIVDQICYAGCPVLVCRGPPKSTRQLHGYGLPLISKHQLRMPSQHSQFLSWLIGRPPHGEQRPTDVIVADNQVLIYVLCVLMSVICDRRSARSYLSVVIVASILIDQCYHYTKPRIPKQNYPYVSSRLSTRARNVTFRLHYVVDVFIGYAPWIQAGRQWIIVPKMDKIDDLHARSNRLDGLNYSDPS